jgi:membrane protein
VILLGAEFNAEIERGRQIQAGRPAEREPFLPARDPARTSREPNRARRPRRASAILAASSSDAAITLDEPDAGADAPGDV